MKALKFIFFKKSLSRMPMSFKAMAMAAGTMLFAPVTSFSAETDFGTIWELVKKNASALKATQFEMEAAQTGSNRASRHWYPRVFLNGRILGTNDPSTSFMYSLNQREISLEDFAPSELNKPGGNIYGQGTLGLDLPLYEGGARLSQAKSASKILESKTLESKAQLVNQYANVAVDYASLLILMNQRKQFETLKESVSGILEHYSIGSKSNPVGYSGLLGLKNLNNRIEGLIVENVAKADSKRKSIQSVAAEIPDTWQPKADRSESFLKRVFASHKLKSDKDFSKVDLTPASVRAAQSNAEAMNEMKDAEKARLLPRVGFFAEGNLYGGDRSAATSYATGVYVQWDVFSAQNFGATDQAAKHAAAADAHAEDLKRKMKNENDMANVAVVAAEKNLILLDESATLLEEQTHVARKLFQNGSINALQLVEVLSRRADLLANRADVELSIAQMNAALFVTTAHDEGMPYDEVK